MRTSKPIATISYNTEEFLTARLEELARNHKISDWIYIKHTAEQDEKKDHIHLWIKPNTLLDTMDLQNFLSEPDIQHPNNKPRGCIDFRSSIVDEWILYSMHFQPYLASKCETREFCYTRDDFRCHDEDSFDDLYQHAMKGSEWSKRNQILQALADDNCAPYDLLISGSIPLQMASQVNALMRMKAGYGSMEHRDRIDRAGRKGHD